MTFDAVTKRVNKKIVDKEISIKKIGKKPKKSNIIIKKSVEEGADDSQYYQRQSISQCRMEKFMSMTAADLPTPTTKPLACMKPVLTTPKDTLRCLSCNVLYDPTKKADHLLICTKTKPKVVYFGCAQCSFKSATKDEVAKHVKESHK